MSFWNNLPKALPAGRQAFFAMAPMADVTDVAFRALVAKRGKPDIFWTEFVSADGLYYTREIPKLNFGKSQLYIGTPSEKDIPSAQAFAYTLRKEGGRVFVNLTARALGDQIKDAVKRGIPYFVAYGADEVASKSVRMKTFATGKEVVLPISDLPTRLRSVI